MIPLIPVHAVAFVVIYVHGWLNRCAARALASEPFASWSREFGRVRESRPTLRSASRRCCGGRRRSATSPAAPSPSLQR
jgi:hypothetical protein